MNLWIRGLLYRLHNMVIHAFLLWAVTGELHMAVGTSLAFNLLNVLLYYHFHLWMGWIGKRRRHGKDSLVDGAVGCGQDNGGKRDPKELELCDSGW